MREQVRDLGRLEHLLFKSTGGRSEFSGGIFLAADELHSEHGAAHSEYAE